MFHYFHPLAGAGNIHVQNLPNLGARAVGEHHDPIAQQHRLIHVVGHHHGGDLVFLANLHQLFLQIPASQSIQRAEGFIQQQQLGLERQGTGDRHSLLHPAGQLTGALFSGLF